MNTQNNFALGNVSQHILRIAGPMIVAQFINVLSFLRIIYFHLFLIYLHFLKKLLLYFSFYQKLQLHHYFLI